MTELDGPHLGGLDHPGILALAKVNRLKRIAEAIVVGAQVRPFLGEHQAMIVQRGRLSSDALGFPPRVADSLYRERSKGSTAGLDDFHLADLRHEAGSRFGEAGVPIVYVGSLLGHSNLSTTSRYLNINRRVASETARGWLFADPAFAAVAQFHHAPPSSGRLGSF